MIAQRQTLIGGPDQPREKWGDCYRAAIASVLGVPVRSLPHFIAEDGDWFERMQEHLGEQFGLELLEWAVEDMGWTTDAWGFRGFWLASVPSKNLPGETHVLVMRGQDLAHDPARLNRRAAVEFSDVRYAKTFRTLEPWRTA